MHVGAISGYNDGGAKTAHYGMHYVDGGSRAHPKVGVLPVACLLSAAHTWRDVQAGGSGGRQDTLNWWILCCKMAIVMIFVRRGHSGVEKFGILGL